jgi:glycosyltransferase involved in cell wall biosynthesis
MPKRTDDNVTASPQSNAPVIKVLLAAPSLQIIGGQSRQAVRLMDLFRDDPSVRITFLPHNPQLPGVLGWLQRIKYMRTVLTTIAYCLLLLFRIPGHDIVHIFSASYYSYLFCVAPAILVGKLYGKKVILNYRSGEAEDHLQNWRTAIPTIKMADRIVTPSGYLVDVFARFNLKARFIFNIVELDRFAYRERKSLRPVFLTSRLLEPLYNVPCVLRAFSLIQQQYPEATLTVAADGWLRPQLEKLAEQLGLKNTRFLGFVPFAEMPKLYDSADIYLTATDIDNMPSSVTECMASGLNVVTTVGGGAIPYIMTDQETGIVVKSNDHEALAAGALRLLAEPEFALRLARNAREASKRFRGVAIKEQWLELYRELTKAGSTIADSSAVKELHLNSPTH